jgi:hypothetical protein
MTGYLRFLNRAQVRIFSTAWLLAAVGAGVHAQTSSGEIQITVSDASGAVVANAGVTITGSDTGNVARTLATNSQGIAAAPLLKPGPYDIAVTANGFDKLIRQGIVVHVGDVLDVRLTLQTGATSTSVTVTGQAPLVEDKSGTLTQVMNERQIIELPLNGRDYLQLANLAAGAVPSRGTRDDTFSAYGNSGLQNSFLLDGARNVNYMRGLDSRTRDMLRPPLDALSEFNVQTSNYSAEFGASAGAVVNAVTKSGTNQLHGSAYDFLRNDNLDAADFFATSGHKPLLVQNQFGGSLGGPIVKNRAWIFGAYEGLHIRSEQTNVSTVPTPSQRSGNFGSTAIYNPFTTVPNPNGNGYVRSPFPNNVIPASLLDATGQGLLDRYPLPNLPGAANNYLYNSPQLQSSHNGTVRGDVQVSAQDSMFFRFSITRAPLDAGAALPAPAQTPVDRNTDSEGIGYGYTRTFGPTLVNEFRFSWTRLTLSQDATLGLDPIINGSLDPTIKSSIPTFSVSGYATIGAQPGCCGNDPLSKSSGVWDLSDNVSKIIGRHQLKFGADYQIIRPTTAAALGGRGSFGFNGVFSQNPQNRTGNGSGVADLLLGLANTANTGTAASVVERGQYAGEYLQDEWSVTSRLTLNLGVRYEFFLPYTEVNNKMANFIIDPGDPYYGQLAFAGIANKPRSLLYDQKNNWAPRIGFAYRVPGAKDLVVRGSYGIFYAQDQGNGITSRMTSNPPFYGYGGIALISDQTQPSTAFVLSQNASIPRPTPVTPQNFALVPSATTALVSWNQQALTPYVQEWNFTVEKQLPWDMVWSSNYVGNATTHLWGSYNANQPLTNGPGSPNTRRPFAQYTDASINRFAPWDRSNYEGVSSRIEKRFGSGVAFLGSFTYGKAIDLQNPALDLVDSTGGGDTVQNGYDLNANRAVGDGDVPLRFVLSGIWDLPFGKGKPLLNSGWAAAVAGRWELSGIYQAQSGLPFTPVLSFDNANAGTTSRPNRVCSGTLSNPTPQEYFDVGCFTTPAQYAFGNSGRNILFGPAENELDFGLHRSFALPSWERAQLQFRAEAFNAMNHPQLAIPNATIGVANAGTISSTAAPNRELQFALRLSF